MTKKTFLKMIADIPKSVREKTSLNIKVAGRIYELLIIKGMTPKDLALKLNKSEYEIRYWMSGFYTFTIETIALLNLALDAKLIVVPQELTKEQLDEAHAKEDAERPVCETLTLGGW